MEEKRNGKTQAQKHKCIRWRRLQNPSHTQPP
jgi:hypothetical protein